jgi:outer membrane protein assembly factor BamE (lipoprotein component of BamABCDE complex)
MNGLINNRRRWGAVKSASGRYLLSRGAMILLILWLPLLLGAWSDVSGNTINPRFVQRIKDGQTKKHEILLYFGEPKEVERTPEGPVFKYVSYKDAAPMGVKREREKNFQTAQPFFLDEEKRVKKVEQKKEDKVPRSTLTIRFKPDGETVMSHEYKEY